MVPPDSTPPKWSRRPQPAAKNPTGWRWLLLALCALAIGAGLYRLRPSTPMPPPVSTQKAKPSAAEPMRLVSLFYPLADGSGLSSIIRKRPACPDEKACLEDLLRALGENPGEGFFPLLPAQSIPPTAWIDGGTATISFRRETIQQIPGGVQTERLLLAALIDTLVVNFPQVQRLAIEVDGVPAETLKGHIDLTVPFVADFSLVRRPLLPSLPANTGSPSERSQ